MSDGTGFRSSGSIASLTARVVESIISLVRLSLSPSVSRFIGTSESIPTMSDPSGAGTQGTTHYWRLLVSFLGVIAHETSTPRVHPTPQGPSLALTEIAELRIRSVARG